MTVVRVYVIMPVSCDPRFQDKRHILEQNALAEQIELRFPMDRLRDYPDGSVDLQCALDDLKTAAGVIVDLSYERPSCYYELGLAEAVGAPVTILAATGTDIHQAAARQDVLFYGDLAEYTNCITHAMRVARHNAESREC